MQTNCPFPLQLLYCLNAPRKVEGEIHRDLQEERTLGEWFFYSFVTKRIIHSYIARYPLLDISNFPEANHVATCKFCKGRFIRIMGVGKFCCTSCQTEANNWRYKDKYRQMRNITAPLKARRSCKKCGERYYPKAKNHTYCTTFCKSRTSSLRKCKSCDKEFRSSKAFIVYCSIDCRNKVYTAFTDKAKIRRLETYVEGKGYQNTCSTCEKNFFSKTMVAHYCTRTCYEKWRYRHTNKQARKNLRRRMARSRHLRAVYYRKHGLLLPPSIPPLPHEIYFI